MIEVTDVRAHLSRTAPLGAVIALLVVWSYDGAGFARSQWAPGGMMVLGLLAIGITAFGVHMAAIPLTVRICLYAFAGFIAFSFVSALWAEVPADALEGATRALTYLLVFALLACWRLAPGDAATLLGVWLFAMCALAGYVLLRLDLANASVLSTMVPGGRLAFPSTYPDADAAQWMIAFWPCALLARSPRVPWLARGLLAGGAVLLAEAALLSQSRGSVYASLTVLIAVIALLPDRLRSAAVLFPIVAGTAWAAVAVLSVGDDPARGAVSASRVHHAVVGILVAATLVAVLFAACARLEQRSAERRVLAGIVSLSIAAIVALAALMLTSDTSDARRSGLGAMHESRLVTGLAGNRPDIYRVAIDEFATHPLLGIGVDNFSRPYLRHRLTRETPRYPHSIELGTLTETGLLGSALALTGLLVGLLASARAATRSKEELGRAVAVAGLAGFGYWLIHGSVDWFWQIAGLAAPAFALVGIACSLSPTDTTVPEADRVAARPRTAHIVRAGPAAYATLALAVAAALAAQWLR